jgi:hypothetical protein
MLGKKPFANYHFIQQHSTLQQKDEIVAKMYELSNNQPFSFGVIGTPFGVRTVWASVFELYTKKHQVPMPTWYGYYANGYPGETLLKPVSGAQTYHFLIIEDNIATLLSKPIIEQEIGNQDNHTRVIKELKMYGVVLQQRQLINGAK